MTPEEELAEAAVLLAHVESQAMPPALERKIVAQSQAIASEIRFTTTRSAAVVMEAPEPGPPARQPSAFRTWGGWIAAAACFALAVYSWRREAIEREHAGRVPAAATTSIALHDRAGVVVARVRPAHDTEPGELLVDALPPPGAGEEYRLWLSEGDASSAIAAGALVCADACADRVIALPGQPSMALFRDAWLTRERRGETVATPVPARVVAEGHGAR